MDNRMRCLDIEFAGIGGGQPANVAGKLDHRHLHPETDAEKWNVVLTRITNGRNLPLATAIAEAARNKNAIGVFKKPVDAFLLDLLRLDAVKIDVNAIGDATVHQSLDRKST